MVGASLLIGVPVAVLTACGLDLDASDSTRFPGKSAGEAKEVLARSTPGGERRRCRNVTYSRPLPPPARGKPAAELSKAQGAILSDNDNSKPTVVLDEHRGMAAQKATDARRHDSDVQADQE